MSPRSARFIALLFSFPLGCGPSSAGQAEDDALATENPGNDGDGTTGQGADGSESDVDDSTAGDSGGSDSSGGDAVPTGPHVDGTRIIALLQRSPNGAEAFDAWFDTERGHECFFGHVGGGEYRCLPSRFVGHTTFADPACTEPAAAEQCDPADVVVRFSGAVCSGRLADFGVWDLGDPVSTIYARSSSGECVETGNAGHRLEPHPVDDFVAAAATWTDFGPLSRQELLAEDGTRQWSGPVITQTEEFCEVREVEGSGRCLTNNRGFLAQGLHTDSSCTGNDVVRVISDASCDMPQVAVDGDTVLGVGESLSGQTIYAGSGPRRCSESSADPSNLRRASAIDVDAFPEAHIELHGSGRLQHRIPVSPDGEQLGLAYPRWRDTELGFDCISSTADGGSTVCGPRSSLVHSDWFSDATCTQPLFRQSGLRPGWYARSEFGDACEASTFIEAIRLDQPYGGPVWREVSDACEPVDDPKAYGDFFEAVQRVDPSGLAIIEFD